MKGGSGDRLHSTVKAVRETMIKRLEAQPLDSEARREIEGALEELDVMCEELQAQAALLVRENERYAEFFEHAPDAYLITDVGGAVREVNEAALELLRMPRESVLGSSLGRFIAGCDRITLFVRAIPLKKGGSAGLCWLMRPAEEVEG